MQDTTVGRLLIDRALPDNLKRRERVLDKKGIAALFDDLARHHPEKYARVAKDLADVSTLANRSGGGFSIDMKHFLAPPAVEHARRRIADDVEMLRRYDFPDEKSRRAAIVSRLSAGQKELRDLTLEASKAENNPLYHQVVAVGRGSPSSLAGLRAGDVMYEDHRGDPLPLPVLSSYSEGLKPNEYWAGSFGARRGIWDVKKATRDAGYLSKQLAQATHRLIVTGLDDPEPHDPRAPRGLPVDIDDPDNEGALLAAPAHGLARDTVLDQPTLAKLRLAGVKNLLIRSPLVGGPADGGVYAKDVGVREKGVLPPRGDYVGIAASQALGEVLSQGQLCLDELTEVRMADWSVRLLRDIRPGDRVLGANRAGQTFPVTVLRTFDNGMMPVRRTTFFSGSTRRRLYLDSTADHRILVAATRRPQTTQVSAGENQVIPVGSGTEKFSAVRADDRYEYKRESIEELGLRPTRDLEVDHPDHLFVLANGLVVSNSSKHTGGVAGQTKAVGGFKAIDALAQATPGSKVLATHAELAGTVGRIRPSAAGGWEVTVGLKDHFLPAGKTPIVKTGDDVERGDALSDGFPNPSVVMASQGIGESRRGLAYSLRDAFRNAGMGAHRRNTELVTRGLTPYVRLTDDIPGVHGVAGDIVPYHAVEHAWRPRADATRVPVADAVGSYLERPVLHYAVGDKVTKRVAAQLGEFVPDVLVHKERPPFEPHPVRAVGLLEHDPDPFTRHLGANLRKSTLESVIRGRESDPDGTSFVPALVSRETFGAGGKTRGSS